MKVLNLIWGFSLGAGIDKCFLTYARLGEVDASMEVKNVCINILSLNSHIEPLREIGAQLIDIRNKRDFSWVGRLAESIEAYRPDVVFTHGFNGAIMMLIERLFRRIKVKTVLSFHGAYNAPTPAKRMLEPIYNGLSIWIYRHLAEKTISVSDFSRQYLIDKGIPAEKTQTVHNGIQDIPMPVPVRLRSDVVTIVSASRIDRIKGLDYLLMALAAIKEQGLSFHYYMIGEGPELGALKTLCRELSLDDDVSFVGFQSNVREWLAAADIFVLPSVYENHSIAVLEAMRAGKAIVATTVGGNSESITDNVEGLLIPSKNSEVLADALAKLIMDPALRQRLAAAARTRFEREFTEEAMMRNIVATLKSCC